MNRTEGLPALPRSASRAARWAPPWALPLALIVLQGCATSPSPMPSAVPTAPVTMAPKAETLPDQSITTANVEVPAGEPREAASAEKASDPPLEAVAMEDVIDVKDAAQVSAVKAVPAAPSVAPHLQAELDAAIVLVKAGQHEQAAEAFKKLAAALPDNPIPPINLAMAYKKLNKLDLAETQLKAALTIEEDNPVAGNELALLYRVTGRFAEARALYEKTLAKYPHFSMAHKNLGVLCDLYLRDYACAVQHYKAYASSAPNDKSVGVWIADLQKRTGTKESQ
jgi:tetratricopeptide (TPR) repeat protein